MKPHEWVAEYDPDALIMEEFEKACIGVCRQYGRPDVVLYDYAKIIAILVAEGLTEEEALEHFDFNIAGAWVGEYTPAFAIFLEPPE